MLYRFYKCSSITEQVAAQLTFRDSKMEQQRGWTTREALCETLRTRYSKYLTYVSKEERTGTKNGGGRARQGGAVIRRSKEKIVDIFTYVRCTYVYVRNCLPVRSLSPLGEVGRPLGEQSRPTASSRATCLARTSSPGVSSLGWTSLRAIVPRIALPISLSSLGHYLACEIG